MSDAEILTEQTGALLNIRLNRPKALNSLSLGMIRSIWDALKRAEHDASIAIILLDGVGEKGLCAGGDVRMIYESSHALDGRAEVFFREEYALNAYIARYPKPYVAFMDGITMGGGVGLSAHGRHRLVTEKTRLAMPETKIGFIPDVGTTWLLSQKSPGGFGAYLALTGTTIGAGDAIYAGLADMMVHSGSLAEIKAALASESVAALGRFAVASAPVLGVHQAAIDRLTGLPGIAEMLAAAADDDSEFMQNTHRLLAERSPSALVYTLHLLRAGRQSRSLEASLMHEYAVATQLIHEHDFREGIRAALIDKDQKPIWNPARVEEVRMRHIP